MLRSSNAKQKSEPTTDELRLRRGKLAERAFVELLHTGNVLNQTIHELFKQYDVTNTQYNVLRILRGALPEALPCGLISERMITKESDITRLLDRLEKNGLLERFRDDRDRRVVRAKISEKGLELLAEMDNPVLEFHLKNFAKFDNETLYEFIALAQKARE